MEYINGVASESRGGRAFERVLEALHHPYRRRLLVALLEHNPQDEDDPQGSRVELREGTVVGIDAEIVRTAMFHDHLPKLEELGYIARDREAGTISKGPNWAEVEPLLRLLDEHREELPADWL
jgi:hypothetical protein